MVTAQKMVNNLMNIVANKDFLVEKINEHWSKMETYIRLAQAFLIKPVPKCDPKDIMVAFSEEQARKEKDRD